MISTSFNLNLFSPLVLVPVNHVIEKKKYSHDFTFWDFKKHLLNNITAVFLYFENERKLQKFLM